MSRSVQKTAQVQTKALSRAEATEPVTVTKRTRKATAPVTED